MLLHFDIPIINLGSLRYRVLNLKNRYLSVLLKDHKISQIIYIVSSVAHCDSRNLSIGQDDQNVHSIIHQHISAVH